MTTSNLEERKKDKMIRIKPSLEARVINACLKQYGENIRFSDYVEEALIMKLEFDTINASPDLPT